MRPISDPDFWWHLRTGKLISETNTIPHIDPYSFTKTGTTWIAHEWLSELIIYELYAVGGFGLLIFTFSILITGAFLISYLRCCTETKPYIAGFVLLLGAISTAPTWGVRPQMITLLFSSAFLLLLDLFQQTEKIKYLVSLPIIMLLWVNLHAGYFMGFVILGIYIIGRLITIILKNHFHYPHEENTPSLLSVLVLCGFLLMCILTSLVNPNGVQILIYPFQTLFSPSMQQLIQEWFSPDFHQVMWQPFAWFLLSQIGIGMLSKRPIKPENIILALVFGYASLRSMRNIPFFIIIAIPILSEQISSLVKTPAELRSPNRFIKNSMPILLVLLLVLTGFHFSQILGEQPRSEIKTFPKTAIDWVQMNEPQGNLFNTYAWGGYLIWRTFPEYKVYIDGRADVYGDSYIYDFLSIYHADIGWEAKLDQQAIRLVLIEPDSSLATALRQSPQWQVGFEDEISIIFLRNN